MKQIVPWQIAMVIVTIGTDILALKDGGIMRSYNFASFAALIAGVACLAFLVVGAGIARTLRMAVSETAIGAAFNVAIASAVIAAFARTAFGIVMTAIASSLSTFGAVIAATFLVTIAIAFIAFIAMLAASSIYSVAKDLGSSPRWTYLAYGIEATTICGALATGSADDAILIGAHGLFALAVIQVIVLMKTRATTLL